MALAPVALFSDPVEDYPANWIKFYLQGTTTPLAMAIDSTGSPTVAKAEISSGGVVPIGFLKTAGDAIFIPYVDEAYDFYLFPTEAEADANDTSNAIQLADNAAFLIGLADDVENLPNQTGGVIVSAMIANTALTIGDFVDTVGYSLAGDGGENRYEIVVAGTGTDDGGSYIDLSGSGHQAKGLFPGNDIRLKQFGAVTGGAVAQNTVIQAAIDFSVGRSLVINGVGSYMVDADVGWVSVPSDSTITWGKQSAFQVITNDAGTYRGLLVTGSNITLIQPFIIGDRDTHIDTGAENGHCLELQDTTSVTIINPRLSKSWGDGLYLLRCVNTVVDNVLIFNARRNGISVIDADGLVINGGHVSLTVGTNPQAGIDLEPNDPSQRLKGIVINDFYTTTGTIGISVVPLSLDNTSEPIDVVINNPTSINDDRGIQISSRSDVKGSIVVNNPYALDSVGNGILIDAPNADGPQITINQPVVVDNNTGGSTSNSASAGINVLATGVTTYKLGNVEINDASVTSSGSPPANRTGINVQDSRSVAYGYENIKINNPKALTTFADTLKVSVSTLAGGVDSDVMVSDKNEVLTVSPTASTTYAPTDWVSRYDSHSFTGNATATLSDNFPQGATIRFDRGAPAFALRITATAADILPLNTGVPSTIDGTVEGSTITLEKFNATSWRVVNQIGTWSVV